LFYFAKKPCFWLSLFNKAILLALKVIIIVGSVFKNLHLEEKK